MSVILTLKRSVSRYITERYIPTIMLLIISIMADLVADTEIVARVLLTLIPIISLVMFNIVYLIVRTPTVSYTMAIDIFSGVTMIVLFVLLLRVLVLHYFQQRKLKVCVPDFLYVIVRIY